MKDLYEAFIQLQSAEECQKFLRDICTLSELKAISERLKVAKKLNEGMSYRMASTQTGASTATVTRVAHWLHHGMGGYRIVLERMMEK